MLPILAAAGNGLSVINVDLSAMTKAIKALYGVAGAVDEFIDRHIEELKASTNATIACTGRVLESAKAGFGIGYLSSVTIMATGQLLLGNPLAAAGVVTSSVTLTNPVAMTCAAVGAIVYGWSALNPTEQADVLARLSTGLEMGVELIRALIAFLLRQMAELLNSKQLSEFKQFIKQQAAQFGRTLSDVTRKVGDFVADATEKAGELAVHAADVSAASAKDGYAVFSKSASAATAATREGLEIVGHAASEAAGKAAAKVRDALKRKGTSDAAPDAALHQPNEHDK